MALLTCQARQFSQVYLDKKQLIIYKNAGTGFQGDYIFF
jgi:hypothetical protein